MRYYIYLDKVFLRSLLSSISDIDFDIEVMEYSFTKGETFSKDISLNPGTTDVSEIHTEKYNKENECKKEEKKKEEGSVYLSVGEKKILNTTIERKYINIEDVSGIKNYSFYNRLVCDLEKLCEKQTRLYRGVGEVFPCKLRNRYKEDYCRENLFFNINNKYIWINSNNLEADIVFLSNIMSEITIVGYIINKVRDIEIIKAIAMYIE